MKKLRKTVHLSLAALAMSLPFSMAFAGATKPMEVSIESVDSFDKIAEQLEGRVDEHTLLVLDVDYTLTHPSTPAFQKGNFSLSPGFIKQQMKGLPSSLKDDFATALVTSGEGELLERATPDVVRAIKAQGAKVIVLTGILTGPYASVPDVMDWRVKNLQTLGIETTSFGFDATYAFKELASYKGHYPEIRQGVILTNGSFHSKHAVLEAFFNKAQWRPKKIIFVDDTRKLVEQMGEYAKAQGIEFIGYEYKGAKKAKAAPISKEELESEWTALMQSLPSK